MQKSVRIAALILLGLPLAAAHAAQAARSPAPQPAAPVNKLPTSSAQLDLLFTRLKTAKSPAEAEFVETMIAAIWTTSPSDTTNLLYHRGIEALAAGDNQLAYDLFLTVTTLSPDFAEGWHELGAVSYAMNAHDEAMVDLERALKLEPRHFGAMMGLAAIYEAYGNKRAALETLRRAQAINPHIEGIDSRVRVLSREVEGQGI